MARRSRHSQPLADTVGARPCGPAREERDTERGPTLVDTVAGAEL